MTDHQAELDRIRSAYRQRDASSAATHWSWGDPAYRFYMQQLEWALLDGMVQTGARLAGRRVLEVGCGSGYFLQRLRDYGAAHAAGIDLMEDRIAQARERYPTLELVAGDAAALPGEDGAFDVVTQFTCLSSVLDPGLRADIAADMWRVLAPGGFVVSFDMVSTPRVVALVRRRAAPTQGGTPTTPIEAGEVRRLFPHGTARERTLQVDPALAALAARSRLVAQLIGGLSFLHTHLLAIVGKPG